jgi:hypothetical protein
MDILVRAYRDCVYTTYQILDGDIPVASAQCLLMPIVNSISKVPETDLHGVRMTCSIIRIHTVKEHRRKKLMSNIISYIKSDDRIKSIKTSYTDSTDAGKLFLQYHGFRQVGKNIIWTRSAE